MVGPLADIRSQKGLMYAVGFLHDSTELFTGGSEMTIKPHQRDGTVDADVVVSYNAVSSEFRGHTDFISSLVSHPGREEPLSTLYDGTIRV